MEIRALIEKTKYVIKMVRIGFGQIGRPVLARFGLGIGVSTIIGLSDWVAAFVGVYFLASFKFIPPIDVPGWVEPFLFNPIGMFIAVSGTRLLLNVTNKIFVTEDAYLLTGILMRQRLARILELSPTVMNFSVAETANIQSTVIPRGQHFILTSSLIVTSAISFIPALIGILYISIPLTGVAVCMAGLVMLPTYLSRRKLHALSVETYAVIHAYTSRLLKGLRNFMYLAISGLRHREANVLSEHMNRNLAINREYNAILAITSHLPEFGSTMVVLLLFLGNYKFEIMPVTTFIVFVYFFGRVGGVAQQLSGHLGSARFQWVFFESMVKYFMQVDEKQQASKVESRGGSVESIKELRAENLSVGWDTPVLTDLNLDFRGGDFYCITGESGKGKTTLLLTLIGLLQPKAGRVLWNGSPANSFDIEALKDKVGYSGPDPFLLDATIRENLMLGNEDRNITPDILNEALEIARCEFVHDLPKGLDTPLSEGGDGVSAGQKQRLSLARAVLRKPDLMVLDEATSNINVELEDDIINGLKTKLPNTIFLAVSHRKSMLKFATARLEL